VSPAGLWPPGAVSRNQPRRRRERRGDAEKPGDDPTLSPGGGRLPVEVASRRKGGPFNWMKLNRSLMVQDDTAIHQAKVGVRRDQAKPRIGGRGEKEVGVDALIQAFDILVA